MRLDKLLANLKYGSRNEIKKRIKDGLVIVNGKKIKKSDIDVIPTKDEIIVCGEKVFYKENITLMLNKPSGYLSSNKDAKMKTVIDLIKPPYNRFDLIICGRLDIDTEGLLLLTTNGKLAHQIISPKKDVYKKYYVKLKKKLENYQILENGVTILDGENKPYLTDEAKIEIISDMECYISIKEGKYHQVKRMFEYISNEVIYLKRIQIGNIILDEKLNKGEYKEIDI